MNELTTIVNEKRARLDEKKKKTPLAYLKEKAARRTGYHSLKNALSKDGIRIIAEIKKASPSAGVIAEEFDPENIARDFAAGGAAALSVVTEEKYFLGDLSYLETIREKVDLALLRKDFIVDEYQIYESAAAGADGLLLIASILSDAQLARMLVLSQSLGMDCLVEVHSADELERVIDLPAVIIGVNNRDLGSMSIDLDAGRALVSAVPKDRIAVVESGIRSADDIRSFAATGTRAFLIGEMLMRSDEKAKTIRELSML